MTEVALLFTARTTLAGNTVPGFSMPTPSATLTPMSTPIDPNASNWSALGSWSGTCFSTGCGSTGWIESSFDIQTDGDYKLQFGVTNWNDDLYDSGMAVAGAVIDGTPIDPTVIPLPGALASLALGMCLLGGYRSRAKRKS